MLEFGVQWSDDAVDDAGHGGGAAVDDDDAAAVAAETAVEAVALLNETRPLPLTASTYSPRAGRGEKKKAVHNNRLQNYKC